MNTYLVPTTEEFGRKYKNITIIYAESEKEAYEKALVQRGLSACHIQNYDTKPYETFYEKINIIFNFNKWYFNNRKYSQENKKL